MRFSENHGIVHVIKPADVEAGSTGESIKMSLYRHVTYILTFGALTGDAVLTVKSGATDGTQTTSETFHYRLADADQAAAGADGYGAFVDVTTLTLTAATYDNRVLIVEIDSDELTADQPWLTLALSNAASTAFVACVAILSEPRYGAHDMPSAI